MSESIGYDKTTKNGNNERERNEKLTFDHIMKTLYLYLFI